LLHSFPTRRSSDLHYHHRYQSLSLHRRIHQRVADSSKHLLQPWRFWLREIDQKYSKYIKMTDLTLRKRPV